jgi:methylated-DNA-[protein]-cysteine S-methyltransferase
MDYAVFPTRLGWMAVAGSERGISAVALPRDQLVTAMETLWRKARCKPSEFHEVTPTRFGTFPERIHAYLAGESVEFPDVIDRSSWTPFRERIWAATMQIPYGQTRSYAWVAATAGQPRACRATGQALHSNPVPILVPCHRVVGADGNLTGFGAGLGLKQELLALEQRSTGA